MQTLSKIGVQLGQLRWVEPVQNSDDQCGCRRVRLNPSLNHSHESVLSAIRPGCMWERNHRGSIPFSIKSAPVTDNFSLLFTFQFEVKIFRLHRSEYLFHHVGAQLQHTSTSMLRNFLLTEVSTERPHTTHQTYFAPIIINDESWLLIVVSYPFLNRLRGHI